VNSAKKNIVRNLKSRLGCRAASRRAAGRVAGSLVAGSLAAALLVATLASCTSKVGYAALVNGSVISQDRVNGELADISANGDYVKLIDTQGGSGPVAGSSAGTYNKAFVAALLDQQVRFEIIRQKLVANKALPAADKVTAAKSVVSSAFPSGVFPKFPPRYQTVLATQQAEADAFVSSVTTDLTPDALNTYYQAHLSDYATEACVRHILIADKDASGQLDYNASLADARKVKAQLDAGGDFAAAAKQYSQDNQGTGGGSAAQGGVLQGSATDSCLTSADLQQLVTEFAQAVVKLPVNSISDPVKTQFGYHLIEVTSRAIGPLDASVTSDIRQRVAGQKLNTLVAKASVKVNPEFGSFDKKAGASGQILGVVPPVAPKLAPATTAAATAGGSPGSTSAPG
jgi:foldase protein PrsA